MSTPVIVLAHGSRNQHADGVIEQIARAAEASDDRLVLTAHLDFSPDTLGSAAEVLVELGYSDAVVVPLLFTRAFHMRHDVPAAVAETELRTGIRLTVADGIGTEDDLAELVAEHALRTVGLGRGAEVTPTRLALYSVGSSVPGANATVADCAERIGTYISARVGAPIHTEAFVATGPQADEGQFHAFLTSTTIVQPLFVAPGTLWDKQRCRMPKECLPSTPLGVALAPLVLSRANRACTKSHF